MTLNQKALLQTVAVFAIVVGGSTLSGYLLSLIDPVAPGIFSSVVLLGAMVYLVFNIVKARLEYYQKLEELNQK